MKLSYFKPSLCKHLSALLSVVLLTVVLAACGNGDAPESSGASDASDTAVQTEEASAAATETAAPSDVNTQPECREISHPQGTTCVPAKPVKTLVLLSEYADYMLAIGETPYAVLVTPQYNNQLLPYLQGRLTNAKLLEGGSDGLNFEAMLALQPDLILADFATGESHYDALTKIAPTVILGELPADPSDRWLSDLQKVGVIFGKEAEAQQALTELDRTVDEAKVKIAQLADKRIAFVRVRDKELQLYGTEGHPMVKLLYGKLGLEPSALTQKERIDLSQELIPDLDAGSLFLQTDGAEGDQYLEEVAAGKLWQSVDAVKNNRTFKTDYWLYLSWGVLGQQEIVRELLQDLELE